MGLDVSVYLARKDDPSKRYLLDWACGRNTANNGLMEPFRDGKSEDGAAEYHSLVFDPEMGGRTLSECREGGFEWREVAFLDSKERIGKVLHEVNGEAEAVRRSIEEARGRIAFDRAKMAYASFEDVGKLREDAEGQEEAIGELGEELSYAEGQIRFLSNILSLAEESMSEYSGWKDCFLLVSFSY